MVFSTSQTHTVQFKFNRGLKSDPNIQSLTFAVASLVGVARRLKFHLPPNQVTEVVRALLVGRVGYGAAAAIFSHLLNDDSKFSLIAKL